MASSFVTRIRRIQHDLHPAERRLAEFLLDFPGELASYSASELARLAHVSNSTVSRFVQRLGYRTYDEARRIVRAEKEAGPALYQSTARTRSRSGQTAAHIDQGRENLQRTFVRIAEAELKSICTAVLKARKVWLVGFRSSHAFASYLRWQIFQVIENVLTIPQGGETLAEHLASIQPTDVVIFFGLRRRPAILAGLLSQTGRTGAQVLYVTDDAPVWTDRTRPKWCIQCDCSSLGPLYNHVSVIALCHLLATKIIEMSGEAGRRRLTAIEVEHEALAEL
jgi:DNA-binding MurR/RpiR family transcriptional regulator